VLTAYSIAFSIVSSRRAQQEAREIINYSRRRGPLRFRGRCLGHPRVILRSSRCPRRGFCVARTLSVLPERTRCTSTCALTPKERTRSSRRGLRTAQKSFRARAFGIISSFVKPETSRAEPSRFTSAEFPVWNYYREKINIDSDLCISPIFLPVFPRTRSCVALFFARSQLFVIANIREVENFGKVQLESQKIITK